MCTSYKVLATIDQKFLSNSLYLADTAEKELSNRRTKWLELGYAIEEIKPKLRPAILPKLVVPALVAKKGLPVQDELKPLFPMERPGELFLRSFFLFVFRASTTESDMP